MSDVKDRQAIAGVVAAVGAIGGAAVVLVGLLVVSIWLSMTNTLGFTDVHIHRTLWGFLTTWDHSIALYSKDGTLVVPAATTAGIRGFWFAVWFGAWFNLWIFYEVCEGIAWPIRAYRNLARRNRQPDRLSAD